MSSGKITGLIILGIVLVVGLMCFLSYTGAYNFGNESEKGLTAQLIDNQNILSNYYNKVQEIVQVNDMYKDGLKEIITASIQGRYGENGAQASWQWIKEHNPTLDVSVYTKLQQVIESGRNEFKNSQTVLIDKKRVYETALGSFWQGMWLRWAGYPKINLADIKVVISGKTTQVYESGIEEPLQLRPSKAVEK